jgi:hypothetical protein
MRFQLESKQWKKLWVILWLKLSNTRRQLLNSNSSSSNNNNSSRLRSE